MKARYNLPIYIVTIFFVSLLIMFRQLFMPGYFSVIMGDALSYTSWAWQFTEALKEGVIYPRWMPLDFWEYGSPTFILYPPLAFYLVAFLNFFTDSIILSMNIAKFAALFLSSLGLFFFVKKFSSDRIALLSTVFYTILPYNILQYYVFGGFASTISSLWFSPILLFTYNFTQKRQCKHLIYAGACYGGLILTHLINAYMFIFIIAAFIIYLSIINKKPAHLMALPSIIATGILLSAAYLLPLFFEKQFINLQAFITQGTGLNFSNYFILPNMTIGLPTNSAWRNFYDIYAFHTLLFCIIILLLFIPLLNARRFRALDETNKHNVFFLGISVVSIFLLFGPSTFLWETIPFFKYIQFPARWLNIATFSIAFLSASGFSAMAVVYKPKKIYLAIVVAFLSCLLMDYFYISKSRIRVNQELMAAGSVNRTLEHLPVTVNIDTVDKDSAFKEKAVIIRGEGKYESIAWKSAERVIATASSQPVVLRIRTFNFPGWEAYVDGKQVQIKTEKYTNAILVDVPEGNHELKFIFSDTLVRYLGKVISALSLAAVAAVFALECLKWTKPVKNVDPRS